MALYVHLYINRDIIEIYSAENLTLNKKGWNTYRIANCPITDDGTGFFVEEIRHKYEDGAAVLARKVLSFVTRKKKVE